MRVAWWSPLPPQRSGIADYSAMLLPHLAQELEIVAVVDDLVASQVSAPAGVPIVPASRYLAGDAGSCAVDIYQMGNHHQFHGYMHGPAIDRPGVLVLHDLSLLDFYLVLCGGPDRLALLEEAHYNDSSVLGKLPETVCGGSSRTRSHDASALPAPCGGELHDGCPQPVGRGRDQAP